MKQIIDFLKECKNQDAALYETIKRLSKNETKEVKVIFWKKMIQEKENKRSFFRKFLDFMCLLHNEKAAEQITQNMDEHFA
ncbi:MAG: hypothetical protein NZZ41_07900 [Candidatus Dojkabacteria bacterium]|nr:hypothetical protein [Candidatus Dojkabacteria bacterium]